MDSLRSLPARSGAREHRPLRNYRRRNPRETARRIPRGASSMGDARGDGLYPERTDQSDGKVRTRRRRRSQRVWRPSRGRSGLRRLGRPARVRASRAKGRTRGRHPPKGWGARRERLRPVRLEDAARSVRPGGRPGRRARYRFRAGLRFGPLQGSARSAGDTDHRAWHSRPCRGGSRLRARGRAPYPRRQRLGSLPAADGLRTCSTPVVWEAGSLHDAPTLPSGWRELWTYKRSRTRFPHNQSDETGSFFTKKARHAPKDAPR